MSASNDIYCREEKLDGENGQSGFALKKYFATSIDNTKSTDSGKSLSFSFKQEMKQFLSAYEMFIFYTYNIAWLRKQHIEINRNYSVSVPNAAKCSIKTILSLLNLNRFCIVREIRIKCFWHCCVFLN